MEIGNEVLFCKTPGGSLIEGKLVEHSTTQNFKGERPWWIVEYGKKSKKTMIVHESQIEGLK
jgi:hypothetical protein